MSNRARYIKRVRQVDHTYWRRIRTLAKNIDSVIKWERSRWYIRPEER